MNKNLGIPNPPTPPHKNARAVCCMFLVAVDDDGFKERERERERKKKNKGPFCIYLSLVVDYYLPPNNNGQLINFRLSSNA